jgi:NAD(P)-dependent dehydrogenase (short-subunit alcohol dehydrogenase family)
MELGLKGRTAVISGGSKGIGKAIAKGLAVEGVNLVLLARGKEALDQAAEEIKTAHQVDVLAVPTDVTNMETVKAAAAVTAERFGTVHIVVNNVHNRVRRPGSQLTWEDKEWMEDVNFKTIGMLRITQAFHPHMARDGSGRIINISGIAGTSVLGDAITHGINNAAMNHLTKYLARELAADQINVNAVIPGIVATEWRHAWAENMAKQQGKAKAEFLDEYMRKIGILAGRWASVEEVTDLVVFLASDRARHINGAEIPVDGGFSVNAR